MLYMKHPPSMHGNAMPLALLSLEHDLVRSIEVDPRVAYLHLAFHLADSREGRRDAELYQTLAPLPECLGLASVEAELGAIYLAAEDGLAHERLCAFMREHRSSLEFALKQVDETVGRRYRTYQSRIKAMHSMHRKMRHYDLQSPYQVLDILAIRIVVEEVAECYAGIEWAKSTWKLVGVKDYIAAPKRNGYQSLHVLVQAPSWTVELQFRTTKMHLEAEYGKASHASYKARPSHDDTRMICALRSLRRR